MLTLSFAAVLPLFALFTGAPGWAELLIAKHPYLKSFLQATTCALFRVDIVRFFHVVRFQEVHQWIPPDPC